MEGEWKCKRRDKENIRRVRNRERGDFSKDHGKCQQVNRQLRTTRLRARLVCDLLLACNFLKRLRATLLPGNISSQFSPYPFTQQSLSGALSVPFFELLLRLYRCVSRRGQIHNFVSDSLGYQLNITRTRAPRTLWDHALSRYTMVSLSFRTPFTSVIVAHTHANHLRRMGDVNAARRLVETLTSLSMKTNLALVVWITLII